MLKPVIRRVGDRPSRDSPKGKRKGEEVQRRKKKKKRALLLSGETPHSLRKVGKNICFDRRRKKQKKVVGLGGERVPGPTRETTLPAPRGMKKLITIIPPVVPIAGRKAEKGKKKADIKSSQQKKRGVPIVSVAGKRDRNGLLGWKELPSFPL